MSQVKYHGRLINKLGLTLTLVLLFSVLLSSFLNFTNFQKNYRQLLQDRLQIVLDDTKFAVEYGLGLGLRLDEQTQVDTLLVQALASDSLINSLLVVNNQNDILFSQGDTSSTTIGLDFWQKNSEKPTITSVNEFEQQLMFSIGLTNAFNENEGYLLLFYNRDELNGVYRDVIEESARYALIVICAAIIFGILVIFLILRPTLNSLQRMLNSLMQLQEGDVPDLTEKNAKTATEHQVVALQKLYRGQPIPDQDANGKGKIKGNWLILATTVTLIITATMVSAWLQLGIFKDHLQPQEQQKALAIASKIVEEVDYLMEIGVPFDRIRGLEEEFAAMQSTQPDVQLIALQLNDNSLLFQNGQVKGVENLEQEFNLYQLPITQNNEIIANVVVGIDPSAMAESLKEIAFDILAILVVAGLLATELILFIVSYTITNPMQGVQRIMQQAIKGDFSLMMTVVFKDEVGRLGLKLNQMLEHLRIKQNSGLKGEQSSHKVEPKRLSALSLNFVRPPLFLLVFSESMSLSFFPMYVESMYEPIANLSKTMVIGLPISVFMAIWALSLPMAGQWSDNVGRRKAFIIGALITTIGLAASGFADNLWHLLAARCFTAVGYAIVFITAQGFITDNTNATNRTKGMATFLSGFFSGSLCGAAIGGILAERIGFDLTFYLSAILSIASALFVAQFFAPKDKNDAKAAKLTLKDFTSLMKNRYFIVITLFSAIPAKVTLTGFLYYAAPLYMQQGLDVSQSSTGRMMMAYGLAIIIISPISALLVDHFKQKKLFIALGGLLSGSALGVLYLMPTAQGVLLAILMIGIGHALGVAPQIALLTELIQDKVSLSMGKIIGIFRMTERIGNVAGPLLAAILITTLGFQDAFLWFAGFLFINVVVMLVFLAIAIVTDKSGDIKGISQKELV
jgi:MFS family permease/HAMP domain-containing protein